jgi:hypothetical protein
MRISIGIYRYISINTATSDLGIGLPRPAFYCTRVSIGIYRYISINTATSDLGSGLPRPPPFLCAHTWYTHDYLCICVYVYGYICTHMYMHTHTHIYIYIQRGLGATQFDHTVRYMYTHIYMYICMCVYTCIYVYIYIYTYTCIYVCIYMCICIYIHIYTYIHITEPWQDVYTDLDVGNTKETYYRGKRDLPCKTSTRISRFMLT